MASGNEQVLRGLRAAAAADAIFALLPPPLMWILPRMRWATMAYLSLMIPCVRWAAMACLGLIVLPCMQWAALTYYNSGDVCQRLSIMTIAITAAAIALAAVSVAAVVLTTPMVCRRRQPVPNRKINPHTVPSIEVF